jgi:hypothetical protein
MHRSALSAHSSISTVRCNAYADAECCREDTPISSLWNVSRSRLTARPAVVFVALRLTLSKPSPRCTCLLRLGWPATSDGLGNSRGRTEMVATPRRDLILSAAMAGAAFGLDEARQQPHRRQPGRLQIRPGTSSSTRSEMRALRLRRGLPYLAEVSLGKLLDHGLPTRC